MRWAARFALAVVLFAPDAHGDEPKRPRITGVAHMAIFAHDLDKSLAFYKDFLGFEEAFRLNTDAGGVSLVFVKVNDRQYIEVFPEKKPDTDRLNHIALEVDDAEAMRVYLAAKGVKVPDKVPVGRIGNANFMIKDPDGHSVEIVEYRPDGRSMQDRSKHLPDTRIAPRIMHVGVAVRSLDKALAFYGDVLGFTEFWRGTSDGKTLSWVNMKVPDGDDYVEFMLTKDEPPLNRLGTMHHICLDVPDVEAALTTLKPRAERIDYRRMMTPRTGTNRKRQLNLFDPDGTRIEVMEPKTVDGTPAPSSTAPPP